jgi:hypothetical protein
MTIDELTKALEKSNEEIVELQIRVRQLESRPIPDSLLLSGSWIKRALAVYGYFLLGSIIIGVPFYCLSILLSF